MNKRLLCTFILLAVATSFLACASHSIKEEPLNKNQIAVVLSDEEIEQVASIEQQSQDDGTVSLLVTSNLRATGFGGCLADRADIEVVQLHNDWVVSSMSEGTQLSFSSCDEAKPQYHFVSGIYADEKVGVAFHSLKKLISGSLPPNLITGAAELKGAAQGISLDDVHLVLVRSDGVEFQVLSRAIAPRILGVRFSIESAQVNGVHLNDDNHIEIIDPYQ